MLLEFSAANPESNSWECLKHGSKTLRWASFRCIPGSGSVSVIMWTPCHEHCECCECSLHRTRPMEQRFQSTCPEIMMHMLHETKGVHGRPDMVLVGERTKRLRKHINNNSKITVRYELRQLNTQPQFAK